MKSAPLLVEEVRIACCPYCHQDPILPMDTLPLWELQELARDGRPVQCGRCKEQFVFTVPQVVRTGAPLPPVRSEPETVSNAGEVSDREPLEERWFVHVTRFPTGPHHIAVGSYAVYADDPDEDGAGSDFPTYEVGSQEEAEALARRLRREGGADGE